MENTLVLYFFSVIDEYVKTNLFQLMRLGAIGEFSLLAHSLKRELYNASAS